jgi:hypothetical protein
MFWTFGEQKNLFTQDMQILNGINIDRVLHSNISHAGFSKTSQMKIKIIFCQFLENMYLF